MIILKILVTIVLIPIYIVLWILTIFCLLLTIASYRLTAFLFIFFNFLLSKVSDALEWSTGRRLFNNFNQ